MSAHIFKQSSASVNGIPIHNETQSYKLNKAGLQFIDIKNGKGKAGRLSLDELKSLINIDNISGPSMESRLEKLIPKTKNKKTKKQKTKKTYTKKKKSKRHRKTKKGTT